MNGSDGGSDAIDGSEGKGIASDGIAFSSHTLLYRDISNIILKTSNSCKK